MTKNLEHENNLPESLSEGDMVDYIGEILRESGEKINFNIGERPIKNFRKGKGKVRATRRISDRSLSVKGLLVVETDSMSDDPFDTTKDLHVWRKVLSKGEDENLKPKDGPKIGEPYIKAARIGDNKFLFVEVEMPYSSGRRIVGQFSEVEELLESWFEGKPPLSRLF